MQHALGELSALVHTAAAHRCIAAAWCKILLGAAKATSTRFYAMKLKQTKGVYRVNEVK